MSEAHNHKRASYKHTCTAHTATNTNVENMQYMHSLVRLHNVIQFNVLRIAYVVFILLCMNVMKFLVTDQCRQHTMRTTCSKTSTTTVIQVVCTTHNTQQNHNMKTIFSNDRIRRHPPNGKPIQMHFVFRI